MNAAFGGVSAAGDGDPEFEVTQRIPSGPNCVRGDPTGRQRRRVTVSNVWAKVLLAGPTTATEAEAFPELPSLLVNAAVLLRVTPQEPMVVLLTTCAFVCVLPASVVGL